MKKFLDWTIPDFDEFVIATIYGASIIGFLFSVFVISLDFVGFIGQALVALAIFLLGIIPSVLLCYGVGKVMLYVWSKFKKCLKN